MRRFEVYENSAGIRREVPVAGWNWWAFFFTWLYMAVLGMFKNAVITFLIGFVLSLLITPLGASIVVGIACGVMVNDLYRSYLKSHGYKLLGYIVNGKFEPIQDPSGIPPNQ